MTAAVRVHGLAPMALIRDLSLNATRAAVEEGIGGWAVRIHSKVHRGSPTPYCIRILVQ
jgi:hypothetical protein